MPIDDGQFQFNLDDVKGKAEYATLLDAQNGVFDYVESGKAAEYLAERRRKIAERKAANDTTKARPDAGTYVEPGFPKRDGEGRDRRAKAGTEGEG